MEEFIEVITDNIQTESCVLMLGPEMAVNAQNTPLHKDLFEVVKRETKLKIEYDVDNFIAFGGKSDKISFYTHQKKYYEANSTASELYQKIAQIPFHLIVSFSPDMILKNAFEQLGITANFQFFNKKQTLKDVERPTLLQPLLYNLFGSIPERDSLIVTYDDMFDFMFSLLGGKQRLPRQMLDTINSATVFLFLGCELDKWYMKLIMRLFELHKDRIPYTNNQQHHDEKTQNFYVRNFEMKFLDMETSTLIEQIYNLCNTNGTLREIKQVVEVPIKKQVKDLIKNEDLETAIDTLLDYTETNKPDMYNTVIQISGNYNRLKKNIQKGILPASEISLETNKIRNSLIETVDEL